MPGREAIPVSEKCLRQVIEEVENAASYPNRSVLWTVVANTHYARLIGLSAQVAMMRAQKWGIPLRTPVGKKGRSKGEVSPNKGVARKQKTAQPNALAAMRNMFPLKMTKLVDRAARGSLKACIKLHCLDCVGLEKKEVRDCTSYSCSLWSVRPYQRKA